MHQPVPNVSKIAQSAAELLRLRRRRRHCVAINTEVCDRFSYLETSAIGSILYILVNSLGITVFGKYGHKINYSLSKRNYTKLESNWYLSVSDLGSSSCSVWVADFGLLHPRKIVLKFQEAYSGAL